MKQAASHKLRSARLHLQNAWDTKQTNFLRAWTVDFTQLFSDSAATRTLQTSWRTFNTGLVFFH